MTPRLSFVIPVRNDAVRLDRCLRSIRAAHQAPDEVEIVVVDNGSSDRSPDVARALGARVLVIENVRVSELRNRGAAAANGEILAFVDADNEIGGDWVAAAIENLGADDVGATGALYLAPADGTWVQIGYGLLRGTTQARQSVEWLGSGNIATWRHVFQRVGGFDTTLEACEDVDFCNRLRAAGYLIVGDPRIQSIHHGDPRTLADLFRSERWRGRDNLRVSFRRPIAWGSIPSAILPVVDVVLIAVGILGVAGTLTGWAAGPAIGLGAFALVALGALLKVARATPGAAQFGAASIVHTFIVAAVYDLARACALVTRAPHRSERPGAAATTAS